MWSFYFKKTIWHRRTVIIERSHCHSIYNYIYNYIYIWTGAYDYNDFAIIVIISYYLCLFVTIIIFWSYISEWVVYKLNKCINALRINNTTSTINVTSPWALTWLHSPGMTYYCAKLFPNKTLMIIQTVYAMHNRIQLHFFVKP